MSEEERHHSVASEAYLIQDEQLRAEAEARNGLIQFDCARRWLARRPQE